MHSNAFPPAPQGSRDQQDAFAPGSAGREQPRRSVLLSFGSSLWCCHGTRPHPGHQHVPAAQGWPARTCVLRVSVTGALGCAQDTPHKRRDACQGRRAGSHPAQVASVPHLDARPLLVGSLCRGAAFTQGWYRTSLEELPFPFPGLGLSLLEASHGVKACRAVPWEADFFLVSAGTRTFTQAGRSSSQPRAAAQDATASRVFLHLPVGQTCPVPTWASQMSPRAHWDAGSAACRRQSCPPFPPAAQPAAPQAPTSSPHFRW